MSRLARCLVPAGLALILSPALAQDAGPGLPHAVASRLEGQEALARGNAAFARQDFPQVIEQLGRYLEENPEHGPAWHQLGYALIASGHPKEALTAFDRQLKLGYRPGVATYNRACSLARLGEIDAAFEALDRALANGFPQVDLARTDPDLANLRSDERLARFIEQAARGVELRSELASKIEAQDWEGAAEIGVQLVDLCPRDGQALQSLGQARLGLGRWSEAAEAFARQAATGFQPNVAAKGLILTRAGIADFDAALAKLKAEPKLWKTGKGVPALEEMVVEMRRLELVPEGRAALNGRDFERAGEVYGELTRIDPDNGMAWLGLGLVLYQRGQHEKALAAFQRQLEHEAAFDTGLHWGARCLVKLGRLEEAIAWLGAARRVGVSGETLRTDADLAPLASHGSWEKLTNEG